jgi:cardiolipin synthase A/B
MLTGKLEKLMCDACNEITVESLGELKGWPLVQSFLAYHFTRRYPRWAQWLPRHVPRLLPAAAQPGKPLGPLMAAAKERA